MPFVYMYVSTDVEESAYLYPAPVSQPTINSSALEKGRPNLVRNDRQNKGDEVLTKGYSRIT
jgi:hypothetical protein